MWLATLLAIAIPVTALIWGRLHVLRDYFFFALYFQFVVYLHVAPTLWAYQTNELT